jgi:hypothetical protein
MATTQLLSVSRPNLLGFLKSANMNSTADQTIPILSARYNVRRITVNNASTSLTLAAGGFYTAASKGGVNIVTAAQLYSGLTGSTKYIDVALLAILNTDIRTETPLYFSLTTAQGGAATADIFIFGDDLS